MPEYKFKKN